MDSTELKNTAVEANPGYERVAHNFEGEVIKGPKEQVKAEKEKAKADTPAEKPAEKKAASGKVKD